MTTFEIHGIVKRRGKVIAVGDSGLFSTDDNRIIETLRQMGFDEVKEAVKAAPEPVKEPVEPDVTDTSVRNNDKEVKGNESHSAASDFFSKNPEMKPEPAPQEMKKQMREDMGLKGKPVKPKPKIKPSKKK